jgi:hypothetical protein
MRGTTQIRPLFGTFANSHPKAQSFICPPLFPPLLEPTTNAFANIDYVAVTTT